MKPELRMGHCTPDPDLKVEINNLLWKHLPDHAPLARAEAIAVYFHDIIYREYDPLFVVTELEDIPKELL